MPNMNRKKCLESMVSFPFVFIICLCFRFVLFRGVSSIVRRCIEKETGFEYAAKIIDVSSDPDDPQGLTLLQASHREISILQLAAGHRFISKNLFQYYAIRI